MLSLEVRIMNSLIRTRDMVGEKIHGFFVDEEGDTNLISIVLVLVIVVALAALFKDKIVELVNKLWADIDGNTGNIGNVSGDLGVGGN